MDRKGCSFPAMRPILAMLFAAGILLLLDQAADLSATILARPVELGAASWRFGLFGLMASRASALVVGDVMLFTAAVALGWRTTLRGLGALHILLAVAVAAGLLFFLLDAVQVRATVPAESARSVSLAAGRAGIVALAGCILLVWAGVVAWRAAGPGHHRGHRSQRGALLVSDLKGDAES